jgi:hypothetical protein
VGIRVSVKVRVRDFQGDCGQSRPDGQGVMVWIRVRVRVRYRVRNRVI